jgi:ABC-type nitrate/sulfonate/bicarbonate transport system substrate-binding protein
MRAHRRTITVITAMSCLAALAACGSSGGGESSGSASAQTSPAAGAATTAGAAGTTSAAAATTAAAPKELVKVPVAFTPSFPALPQYVAQAEGFYKDHGLDVEPVQVAAGPEMGAAMIGGDITFAGNIPNNQITLKDAGFDVVGVAQQVGSQFFDLAVSSKYDLKGATEWQDVMKALKGAKVGVVANGAAAEDIARTLFDKAGVDPDAQTYIATGLPDTTLAALINGQVDAAVNFDPLFVLAKQQGAAVQPFSLRAGQGPEELIWPSLLVTTARKYAEEHPDVVKEYVAATSEAIKEIQDPAKKDRITEIMTKDMGLPAVIATGMLESGTSQFTDGMKLDTAALDRAGAWVYSIGKSKQPYTAADFTMPVG